MLINHFLPGRNSKTQGQKIPVDTQRRLNIYKMSSTSYRRLIDVETMSCVYCDKRQNIVGRREQYKEQGHGLSTKKPWMFKTKVRPFRFENWTDCSTRNVDSRKRARQKQWKRAFVYPAILLPITTTTNYHNWKV